MKGTHILSQFSILCPFRLITSYAFPTSSIFTCTLLPKSIFVWHFLLNLNLKCHNSEPVPDFDLISTLKARPKYQLSSVSLVMENYTQKNQLDCTQKNGDWASLGNPLIVILDQHFKKTKMTTYFRKYTSK